MNSIYLSYQAHTLDQFAKAVMWAKQLIGLGYQVYLPANHGADGVLNGQNLKVRTFDQDFAALRHASHVIICVAGNDFTGAEFELGMLSALMETGQHNPHVFVCDLQETNEHPLGELYTGSLLERTAALGAVGKHAHRIESVTAMTDTLASMIGTYEQALA